MDNWHQRYNEACQEIGAAQTEWTLAEAAMARANARQSQAERKLRELYAERAATVNATV